MDNINMKKVIVIGLVMIMLIPVAIFIAVYLHCVFSQMPIVFSAQETMHLFMTTKSIQGLFVLTLGFMGLAGFALLLDNKSYRSPLITITNKIKTPAVAGEGQHGTARWQTKEEQHSNFGHMVIKRELLSKLKKEGGEHDDAGGRTGFRVRKKPWWGKNRSSK